ncbi:MAG: PorT family protein [Cytophagaceae bacterium]|nr:PorT family protein [Cytophagaceae bacterium]
MNETRGHSDEELDGLFREAADGYRPRFDPDDWRKMTARLAAATPPRPWWQRRRWGLLALLLLLTGAGVFWGLSGSESGDAGKETSGVKSLGGGVEKPQGRKAVFSNEKMDQSTTEKRAVKRTDPQPDKLTNPTTGASARMESTDESVPETGTNKAMIPEKARKQSSFTEKIALEKGNKASSTEVRKEKNRRNNRTNSSEKPLAFTRPDRLATERTVKGNPGEKVVGQSAWAVSPTRRQTNRLRSNQTPAGESRDFDRRLTHDAPNGSQPDAPMPLTEVDQRTSVDEVNFLEIRGISVRNGLAGQFPAVVSVATPPAAPLIRRTEPTRRGRWGVRALLAPDFNSVSTLKPAAFGRSFGVLLEYEVLPRWRIQAGAIRSEKSYDALFSDYTKWNSGYWAVDPERVNADCRILDLPVNLRFDALRRTRYDVFVSAGVSSYLMRSEVYKYYFPKTAYIYPNPREREFSRANNHLASTLNLSAGYERQLGHGFSLQVEPYLKLPLSGVGAGGVRLYSTGLHLSLGFHAGGR